MPSKISVVSIGRKVCRPFVLEVMVFSPESGYKFKVVVERSCTREAEPVWKLVFDLYRVGDGEEIQLVHVSYTGGTPVEQQAIEQLAGNGVSADQSEKLVQKVFPAAKALKPGRKPTAAQKAALKQAMASVVSVDL